LAKNEHTSPRVAKVASKALRGKKLTKKETQELGGSALTQVRNKPKRRKSK
jgi:hypothetical protein